MEEWLRSDQAVQEHLRGLQAILLNLTEKSTDADNFTQLYPAYSFPTVTVVGLQGTTLATISAPDSAATLTTALAAAREAYQKQILSQQLLMAMMTTAQQQPGGPVATTTSATQATSSTTREAHSQPDSQPQRSQPNSQTRPTVMTPQRPPRPKPRTKDTAVKAPAASPPPKQPPAAQQPPPPPTHTQLQFRQTDGASLRCEGSPTHADDAMLH